MVNDSYFWSSTDHKMKVFLFSLYLHIHNLKIKIWTWMRFLTVKNSSRNYIQLNFIICHHKMIILMNWGHTHFLTLRKDVEGFYLWMLLGFQVLSNRQNLEACVYTCINTVSTHIEFCRRTFAVQPTPVFLPGESQGWGSLAGCHLWGRTESDTTEAT